MKLFTGIIEILMWKDICWMKQRQLTYWKHIALRIVSIIKIHCAQTAGNSVKKRMWPHRGQLVQQFIEPMADAGQRQRLSSYDEVLHVVWQSFWLIFIKIWCLYIAPIFDQKEQGQCVICMTILVRVDGRKRDSYMEKIWWLLKSTDELARVRSFPIRCNVAIEINF